MSTFIEMLEDMANKDTKVRAVLKRSLAFDPGCYPLAFPYVEPRFSEETSNWKRIVYYLVAGLWAMHRQEQTGTETLPGAFYAFYKKNGESKSLEKRFIALLDADEEQIVIRLRRTVALLKEFNIDFNALLNDLLFWNVDSRRVQIKWAKIFYHSENSVTFTKIEDGETL